MSFGLLDIISLFVVGSWIIITSLDEKFGDLFTHRLSCLLLYQNAVKEKKLK